MRKIIKILLPLILIFTLAPINFGISFLMRNMTSGTGSSATADFFGFIINTLIGISWLVVIISMFIAIPWVIIALILEFKNKQQ